MDKKIDRMALVERLEAKMGPGADVFEDNTHKSIRVSRVKLLETMRELKDNPLYEMDILMNLSSVDYPENLTVIYHLNSLRYQHHLTVKVEVSKDNPRIPSVSSIWKAAQAQEREVFDLMGIIFDGHPYLRRILLPDDFVGHPLRKDFHCS
ncbi:MAG: NADH-quinone oxidoreductase subunit C [Candidatus Dichloromethanomonas elyunquensis]|nr:MAG: NADH-quinone oxidoreductase subunit C [Candidatus Dichloromethanomonas elyunquensis]